MNSTPDALVRLLAALEGSLDDLNGPSVDPTWLQNELARVAKLPGLGPFADKVRHIQDLVKTALDCLGKTREAVDQLRNEVDVKLAQYWRSK